MPISDGLVALVSVIMPCRNAGVALRPALASVMAQSYPNLEIIFVDDGSTDGSRVMAQEMARACDRPLTITAAATRGLNAARIHGLAHARGEYVQWMDADDELDRHKIASQIAVLEANPAIDIAYGDWTTRMHRKVESARERRRYLQPANDQIRRTLSAGLVSAQYFSASAQRRRSVGGRTRLVARPARRDGYRIFCARGASWSQIRPGARSACCLQPLVAAADRGVDVLPSASARAERHLCAAWSVGGACGREMPTAAGSSRTAGAELGFVGSSARKHRAKDKRRPAGHASAPQHGQDTGSMAARGGNHRAHRERRYGTLPCASCGRSDG